MKHSILLSLSLALTLAGCGDVDDGPVIVSTHAYGNNPNLVPDNYWDVWLPSTKYATGIPRVSGGSSVPSSAQSSRSRMDLAPEVAWANYPRFNEHGSMWGMTVTYDVGPRPYTCGTMQVRFHHGVQNSVMSYDPATFTGWQGRWQNTANATCNFWKYNSTFGSWNSQAITFPPGGITVYTRNEHGSTFPALHPATQAMLKNVGVLFTSSSLYGGQYVAIFRQP